MTTDTTTNAAIAAENARLQAELDRLGESHAKSLLRLVKGRSELTRLRAATRVRMTACPALWAGFKEFAGEAGRCENNHVVKDTWIEPTRLTPPADDKAALNAMLLQQQADILEEMKAMGWHSEARQLSVILQSYNSAKK